jgi:hypothetical protein
VRSHDDNNVVHRPAGHQDSIVRSFQPVQARQCPARLLGGITTSCVVAFAVLAGLVASHWPVLWAGDQAGDAAAHGEVLTRHWLLGELGSAKSIKSSQVWCSWVRSVGRSLSGARSTAQTQRT